MFDHTSRYFGLPVASRTAPDGVQIPYVRRRFLPTAAAQQILAEVAVLPGERLDLLAFRVYGDPLAYWRLCDGAEAMDPLDMLRQAAADPQSRLRAPSP